MPLIGPWRETFQTEKWHTHYSWSGERLHEMELFYAFFFQLWTRPVWKRQTDGKTRKFCSLL